MEHGALCLRPLRHGPLRADAQPFIGPDPPGSRGEVLQRLQLRQVIGLEGDDLLAPGVERHPAAEPFVVPGPLHLRPRGRELLPDEVHDGSMLLHVRRGARGAGAQSDGSHRRIHIIARLQAGDDPLCSKGAGHPDDRLRRLQATELMAQAQRPLRLRLLDGRKQLLPPLLAEGSDVGPLLLGQLCQLRHSNLLCDEGLSSPSLLVVLVFGTLLFLDGGPTGACEDVMDPMPQVLQGISDAGARSHGSPHGIIPSLGC